MKRRILACASLLFLLPAARADSLTDDNARLRQQVLELQARNAALERACPAAALVSQPAEPAAAAAPAIAAAAAPAAVPMVHQSPQFFAPAPAPVAAATPAPPAPPAPPLDYASTGCDRSFWKGPAAGKWQDAKAWRAIHRGMSQDEVEALLGIEHYNLSEPQGGPMHWQYGRCNSGFDGEVVFRNGVVTSYSAP